MQRAEVDSLAPRHAEGNARVIQESQIFLIPSRYVIDARVLGVPEF
jgi:hypothetical protein